MEFKNRIKELRQNYELSAFALAERLGKSESTIRMWESGKNKPDADTLITLSKMFGCTVDYLMGISEFKSEKEAAIYYGSEKTLGALLDKMPVGDKKKLINRFTLIISALEYLRSNCSLDARMDKLFFYSLLGIMDEISQLFIIAGAYYKEKGNASEDEKIIKFSLARLKQLEYHKQNIAKFADEIYGELNVMLLTSFPDKDFSAFLFRETKRSMNDSKKVAEKDELRFDGSDIDAVAGGYLVEQL